MQPANQCSIDLTFEEASGLRYAAGYVYRALKKKFATDSEFVECIDELVKDEVRNVLTVQASGNN